MPDEKKDCINCPSYLDATTAASRYGRGIGSPVCATYGTPLGKPGLNAQQAKKLRQEKAKDCPSYGDDPPAQLGRRMEVMLPDPTLRDPDNIDDAKMNAVTTCAACQNMVSESIVVGELGWTAGVCVAKGTLIPTNRQSVEARNCPYRQFGTTRGTTSGLNLLVEYTDEFLTGTPTPVEAYFKAKKHGFVEPGDWPTDKEVTPEDEADGIKSWRKFQDPDGSGKEVFFPIFRRDFFTEDEQALIPETGSDEHPELYVDHFGGMYGLGVAWFELDETPALWGQPGVGKTELGRYAAWIMQIPFRRVSITKSTELDDIAGKMLYSPDQGTYFQYGRLPIAWIRPGVLTIDEPNAGEPDVWQFIRPMTDNSKQLVLDMNKNEALDRNDYCFPMLAMNPAWDARNVGAMEIADADSNRLFHTEVNMPPKALEMEIIQSYVKLDGWELSRDEMDRLMRVAADLRNLSQDEGLQVTWALRQQIKVARALRWFTPLVAYRRAIGDFLDMEQRQILLDQVKAHWPSED